MNYRQEYEKWVSSPAITDEEHAELRAIADDDKEIESPVLRPAGVRHRRPARHDEDGPAPDERLCHPLGDTGLREGNLRRGRGGQAPRRRHLHGLPQPLAWTSPAPRPRSCAGKRHPCAHLRVAAPHAGAVASPCGNMAARPASTSPPATTPRNTTATRSTGPTARSCRPSTPTPSPPSLRRSTSSRAWSVCRSTRRRLPD